MDPVSAVGLGVTIFKLGVATKNLISNMYEYYEAVRDAQKRSQELRQELSVICDLLFTLEEVVSSPTSLDVDFPTTPALVDSIQELRTMVNQMNVRVAVPKTAGLGRRLKWPFSKAENDDRLDRIGRYKQTFTLALNIKNA